MLGVDESFKPLPANRIVEARRKLDLPPRYLLFVGTFEPRKNIIGLLQAYHQLVQRLPSAPPLVLAGILTAVTIGGLIWWVVRTGKRRRA